MIRPTAFQVRAALLNRGFTVAAWARLHGYEASTVSRTVARWTQPRPRQVPHGQISRCILADLTRDLDMTIVPGIAPSQPQSDPGRKAA